MTAIDYIESARLEIQSRLDSEKTPAERNRLGQFATPTALATEVLEFAKSLIPPTQAVRFLDPAIGTGSFYSALLRVFSNRRLASATGYEIDAHHAKQAAELWGDALLDLRVGDFTKAAPPAGETRANLLICNPPYVRHHHVTGEEKLRLQKLVGQAAGVSLSGLAGLYCYFMCLSPAWLAPGGLAGWLVPSEFMDVNYGRQVKEFLLNRVTLLRIHRFAPDDVQFADALVSSAVVWFKNAPPPKGHAVEFCYGGTLTEPGMTVAVSSEELRRAAKWTRFPRLPPLGGLHRESAKLSDLFKIKRGLATGANEFFILTPEQAREYDLPAEFLLPILPSPRHLMGDEIEADADGLPEVGRKLFLLSCNLPEPLVRERHPALWRYLELGVERGISERYLSKSRSPWYSQESRPPAPILCTYMGRQGAGGGRPFRFILNRSKATAANVYLMLYPKPPFEDMPKKYPEVLRAIWQHLNQTSIETLTGEGRVYGGGLYKLEPRELGNVPVNKELIKPVRSRDVCLWEAL